MIDINKVKEGQNLWYWRERIEHPYRAQVVVVKEGFAIITKYDEGLVEVNGINNEERNFYYSFDECLEGQMKFHKERFESLELWLEIRNKQKRK